MYPKVSIIIPVYNGVDYLSQAIESALDQTYRNREVIVVDDGSTDGTWDVISAYRNRVVGIRKANGGVASALNRGIAESTGKYLAWLSHDDLWLPEKLERQLDFLRIHPDFNVCYTDFTIINSEGQFIGEVECPWFPRQKAVKAMFEASYINGSTILIDRTCFEKVGHFDENLRYNQDTEMWLRLLSRFEIGRVPEKLGKQRRHPNQGSVLFSQPQLFETQKMYEWFFEKTAMSVLFPECASSPTNMRKRAECYVWLGETMARERGWFRFAYRQYRKALDLYPSWKNRALLNILTNLVLFVERYTRSVVCK